MGSSRPAFDNDTCPVADELLGSLYRDSEQVLRCGGVVVAVRAGDAGAVLLSPRPSAFAEPRHRCDLQRARSGGARRPRRIDAHAQSREAKPVAAERRRGITLPSAMPGAFVAAIDDEDEAIEAGAPT